MITNFEEITIDLSPEEVEFVPILVEWLERTRVNSPLKAKYIVKILDALHGSAKFKINDVRLRKLTNYIRIHSIIPLIATSDGYYVSYDQDTIKSQVKSLTERAHSILSAAKGLNKFVK